MKIIAPPPKIYLSAMLIGLAIHLVVEESVLQFNSLSLVPGLFLFLISTFGARWSFTTMKKVSTTASPYKKSDKLIVSGPFQYSRNPIYLAMTTMYVGGALIIGSIWVLLMLVPLLILMHWGVIFREEEYLSLQFGDAYSAYKSNVRRWV